MEGKKEALAAAPGAETVFLICAVLEASECSALSVYHSYNSKKKKNVIFITSLSLLPHSTVRSETTESRGVYSALHRDPQERQSRVPLAKKK